MVSWTLEEAARSAVSEASEENKVETAIVDPNSNSNTANQLSIVIARKFLTKACPAFLEAKISSDDDRLVKIGRSIADLVSIADVDQGSAANLNSGISAIVEQADVLANGNLKVPKVRFGKTELQMPVVTIGCMRFQQTWGSQIKDVKSVKEDCQRNVFDILKYGIEELGMNHIETANMYGSSEIQLGEVFEQLFESGIKREDLIIQTKVNAYDVDTFRKTIEDSFSKLRLDYIDLFSFHGT